MNENEVRLIVSAIEHHDQKLDTIGAKIDLFRGDFEQHRKDDATTFAKIKTAWLVTSGIGLLLFAVVKWLFP